MDDGQNNQDRDKLNNENIIIKWYSMPNVKKIKLNMNNTICYNNIERGTLFFLGPKPFWSGISSLRGKGHFHIYKTMGITFERAQRLRLWKTCLRGLFLGVLKIWHWTQNVTFSFHTFKQYPYKNSLLQGEQARVRNSGYGYTTRLPRHHALGCP